MPSPSPLKSDVADPPFDLSLRRRLSVNYGVSPKCASGWN